MDSLKTFLETCQKFIENLYDFLKKKTSEDGNQVETLRYKLCDYARVGRAWTALQRRLAGTMDGWRWFEDLARPALVGMNRKQRVTILRIFIKYISFVNNCYNVIDANALNFHLVL